MTICTVPDCGMKRKASGFCAKHYYRQKKYGSPLIAQFVPAVAGAPAAFIDGLNIIGEGCVIWPYAKNNMGYGQINLGGGKKVLAHRVACERRNGPPPSAKHQAAHSCGCGHLGCVAPWHLSWKTPKENAADSKVHGTHRCGVDAPWAKIDGNGLRFIAESAGIMSQQKIASHLGVSQTAISKVLLGKIHIGSIAEQIGIEPEQLQRNIA